MWSENYAFMFTDPVSRIGAMCLLGRWLPNPEIWREFLVIGLPGGTIAHHKAFGRACTSDTVSASLVKVSTLEPGQRFKVMYDGPIAISQRDSLIEKGVAPCPLETCHLSIEMEGRSPVWDMSGTTENAEHIAGKMHVEQVGVANGSISFDGQSFALSDAFAQRDHSRGIRDVRKFHRHCWAQGYFPEAGVTFNVYAISVFGDEMKPMLNASVTKGNQRVSADVRAITLMETACDGLNAYSITLASEFGEMTFELVSFVASIPVSFTSPWDISVGSVPGYHAASGFEEAVMWKWGEMTGAGWSERAFNEKEFAA